MSDSFSGVNRSDEARYERIEQVTQSLHTQTKRYHFLQLEDATPAETLKLQDDELLVLLHLRLSQNGLRQNGYGGYYATVIMPLYFITRDFIL